MEQILESTYYENEAKWNEIAMDLGGIEICDDTTGEPIYTIGSISSWEQNGAIMNKKQRELLVALKEALEAQPEMPSYSDYEEY